MPRFTVLLPTHNRADVIGFAIRSVLAQTETDFELFVVGDGCTDGTAEVVAAFSDPRIRWFDFAKAPHSGYANRNVALREARGELIAYAQHDDLMLPDHLALLGGALGPDIDWAYSRPLWVTTDGIVVPSGTNLTMPDELDHFLAVRNTIPSSCVMHRRDCLERFGYWPEDSPRVADWLLWRAMIQGAGPRRIAYLPTATALHFSAVWKESRHAAVPEVATWLAIIEQRGWWPPALRRSVPAPQQEQRVWFEALQDGGAAFVAELRAAIDMVMDRQGWNDILHTLPRVGELETAQAHRDAAMEVMSARVMSLDAQAANLEVSLQQAAQDLQDSRASASLLQRHLDTILASRSWRMTEPVRRLRRFLRKP
jgi:GT2 family glycosyltransferase